MKTLLDVLPSEFAIEYQDSRAWQMRHVQVINEGMGFWPGAHKNVHIWWELENGYAVGWNENPGRGWSFPVIKHKNP